MNLPICVLVVLCPDGTSRAFVHPGDADIREIDPASSGDDRGVFRVYEVAGYSIDVMRLPEP